MNSSLKVPLAVAGGYILGRRKKARLALLLGAWLVGRSLHVHPVRLGREAITMAGDNPAVGKLGGEVKEQLLAAGRNAVLATANSQMEKFADRLHDRTESLTGGAERGEPEDDDERGPEAEPRAHHRKRAAGAPEGERPVSRERAAGRKSASKAEGSRKPAGRKSAREAAGKGGRTPARAGAGRSSRSTRDRSDS